MNAEYFIKQVFWLPKPAKIMTPQRYDRLVQKHLSGNLGHNEALEMVDYYLKVHNEIASMKKEYEQFERDLTR